MSPDLREHIVQAIEADLVGLFGLDPAATESLSTALLRWYTTGFLAPSRPVLASTRRRRATIPAPGSSHDGSPRSSQRTAPLHG